MQIQNAAVTGSFTYNGVDISSITGSTSNITSLNATTASILSTTASLNLYTGSNDTNISNINSTTASLNLYTGSNNTNISNIHSTTASLNTFSGSANSRLASIETVTGSNISRLNSIESTTGSLNTASGSAITRLNSIEVVTGSNISRLSSLESKTGSYATTGSNTFVSTQYISASNNPTGFTTTASLYTDGGLRVTKDAYISGTLYLNNVTVYGTQSVAYITSSQLNIASNLITVNTATPSVRFGGLAVYDSGSSGLTGSMLWDSQNNSWIYSNPSGSGNYDSAMVIMGPRNSSTLGSEVGLTCNYLVQGHGHHHTTSSTIFHDGSTTCFPSTVVGGGTISGTTIYGSTAVCSAVGKFTTCIDAGTITSTALTVATSLTGIGRVVLNSGDATHSGYINWYNSSVSRLGYMGYNNTDIELALEGTSTFKVTGGTTCFACSVTATNNITISSTTNASLVAATNSTTGYSFVDLINNGVSGKNYQIGIGANGAPSGYANNLYFDLVGTGTIMTLTSGRNIGINTTNFGERLNIGCGGAIAWQNTCNCQKWHIQYNSADGLNFVESAVADFRLFLKAGGNVGVGLSTPTAQLHICSAYSQTPLLVQGGGNGNVPIACFYSGVNQLALLDDNGNLIIGSTSFSTRGTVTSSGLLVTGRVGIGTASPCVALDVSSATGATISATTRTNDACCSEIRAGWGGGSWMRMGYYPTTAVGYIDNTYQVQSGQPFGDIQFRHNISGTPTTRMTLKGDGGQLMIGTSCAAFGRRLTVSTDVVAYYSDQESMTMGISAGTGAQSWGIQVCDTGDGSSALHLNARGGPVGINIGAGNSASYPLHVNGTAYATGAAGALSDIRHKQCIQPLSKGLAEVMKLNPVEFAWKEEYINDCGMLGTQLGFVAQEVQEILPTNILTDRLNNDTLALKYNEYIPLLTKAIQEQQYTICSQATIINTLKTCLGIA